MTSKLLELKRKAPPVNVGDPILIVEDDRSDPDIPDATGQIGQYEGEKPLTVLINFHGTRHEYYIKDVIEGKVTVFGRPILDVVPPMPENAGLNTDGWVAKTNPCILLPDGSHIFGIQCWWRPVLPGEQIDMEKEKARLARAQKMFARDVKSALADISE